MSILGGGFANPLFGPAGGLTPAGQAAFMPGGGLGGGGGIAGGAANWGQNGNPFLAGDNAAADNQGLLDQIGNLQFPSSPTYSPGVGSQGYGTWLNQTGQYSDGGYGIGGASQMPQYYDPLNGMGGYLGSTSMVQYPGSGGYGGYGGGGGGGPWEAQAASNTAAGNVGAATAAAQGATNAAGLTAEGNVAAANAAAAAAEKAALYGLQGTQAQAGASENVAQTQAGAQEDVAGLGLQGTQVTAADALAAAQAAAKAQEFGATQQLTGVQTTAADQLAAANRAAQASENVATTTTAPSLLRSQALVNFLQGQGGGGVMGGLANLAGGILGSAGGLGGGSAGSAPATASAGGPSGGATPGALGGASQPVVPQYSPIDTALTQQNLGAGNAAIDQQMGTLANQLAQHQGSSGMNASAGGGLPPGLADQLGYQSAALKQSNALNWENLANQSNNQNALAYSGANQNAYAQQQNRMLAELGLGLQGQQGIISALGA